MNFKKKIKKKSKTIKKAFLLIKFMFPVIKEEDKEVKNGMEEKIIENKEEAEAGKDEFSKRFEALQSNLATKLGQLKRESIKAPPPFLNIIEPKNETEVIDSKNFKSSLKKKLLIDPNAEENKNSIRPHTVVTPSGELKLKFSN